jgi:ketosteroid isomerase-like protein
VHAATAIRSSGPGLRRLRAGQEPDECVAACLLPLRDGKIVRVDFYWDRDEAIEAAGLPG